MPVIHYNNSCLPSRCRAGCSVPLVPSTVAYLQDVGLVVQFHWYPQLLLTFKMSDWLSNSTGTLSSYLPSRCRTGSPIPLVPSTLAYLQDVGLVVQFHWYPNRIITDLRRAVRDVCTGIYGHFCHGFG